MSPGNLLEIMPADLLDTLLTCHSTCGPITASAVERAESQILVIREIHFPGSRKKSRRLVNIFRQNTDVCV